MANIKGLIAAIILSCSAIAAGAQSLPAKHNDLATEKTDMAKIVATTFLDQALDEAAQHSPFSGIAESMPAPAGHPKLANSLTNYAKRFLGTRYLLGGTTPRAFDCSGFVGYVYRNFGINLDRTSRQQYLQGDRVNIGNLQPGDLLFFRSRRSGGAVGHVAMVVSVDKENKTCRFIHASTKKGVSYQSFPDNGYYSRNFIGAKRIIGSADDNSRSNRSTAQR